MSYEQPVIYLLEHLNKVYESSASTFNERSTERFEVKTKERLVSDQGLVLLAVRNA